MDPILENIENWFTFHRVPDDETAEKYRRIRSAGKQFAQIIAADVPPSAERDEAIAKLRETVMWANAGIACNG